MHGNPQETLFAYIAGIIDGEGTVFICKTLTDYQKENGRLKNPKYVAGISVKMTNKKPIQFIYDVTKLGVVYRIGARLGREQHKPFWEWKAGKTDGVPFIKLIRKYLLVKDKQADLFVKFYENKKAPFDRQKGLSPKELQWREDMRLQMCELNRLGVLATTESFGAERSSDSLNS